MKSLIRIILLTLFFLGVWTSSRAEQITGDQKAQYFMIGSQALYRQVLTLQKEVQILNKKLEIEQLQKERDSYDRKANAALAEMARFREEVLGDHRCTIDDIDGSVECPQEKPDAKSKVQDPR